MKPASITSIENQLFDVINLNKEIKAEGYSMEQAFGSESEYTLKAILWGVKSILTDLSFLVRNPNVFLRLSTIAERNLISANLQSLKSYLDNRNFSSVVTYLDSIKIIIRQYNLRTHKEYFADFHQQYDQLRVNNSEVESLLSDVNVNRQHNLHHFS